MVTTAHELLGRVADKLTGGRSFGPAFEHDGCLVIPVAYVFGGGGGGSQERHPDEGGPTGDGGGFGLVSWPIGAYEVKDGRVRFRPAIDLLGLAMVASRLVVHLARMRHSR